jgi:hypothetical protein
VFAVESGDLWKIFILQIESVISVNEIDVLIDVEVQRKSYQPGFWASKVGRVQNFGDFLRDIFLLELVKRLQGPNDFCQAFGKVPAPIEFLTDDSPSGGVDVFTFAEGGYLESAIMKLVPRTGKSH